MKRKIYLSIIVLSITALVLELVNIHLSGRIASDSVAVKIIQERIGKQAERNQIMQSKVLELTSFENVASRAGELGFKEADSYISLHKSIKVAFNR